MPGEKVLVFNNVKMGWEPLAVWVFLDVPVPERPFVSADVGDLFPPPHIKPRLGASTENDRCIVCRNDAKMIAGLLLGTGPCVWLLYMGLAVCGQLAVLLPQLAARFPEPFRASCSDRAQRKALGFHLEYALPVDRWIDQCVRTAEGS